MTETDKDKITRYEEALREIGKWATEHDLDCEEGVGSDRCTPCLVQGALEKRDG